MDDKPIESKSFSSAKNGYAHAITIHEDGDMCIFNFEVEDEHGTACTTELVFPLEILLDIASAYVPSSECVLARIQAARLTAKSDQMLGFLRERAGILERLAKNNQSTCVEIFRNLSMSSNQEDVEETFDISDEMIIVIQAMAVQSLLALKTGE